MNRKRVAHPDKPTKRPQVPAPPPPPGRTCTNCAALREELWVAEQDYDAGVELVAGLDERIRHFTDAIKALFEAEAGAREVAVERAWEHLCVLAEIEVSDD